MNYRLIVLLTSFIFTSCSGVITRFHKQIDREDYAKDQGIERSDPDKFKLYREAESLSRKRKGQGPPPLEASKLPSQKRNYVNATQAQKRYKANDLYDNGNAASLWSGDGRENFLLSEEKKLANGDIILVHVLSDLKEEITLELKRAFPEAPKTRSTTKAKSAGAQAAPQAPKEQAPKTPEGTDPREVYDRISTIIIDEINDTHVLLKGRKQIFFKNKKHTIELQALVSKRDIEADDSVKSSTIIEKTVTVVY